MTDSNRNTAPRWARKSLDFIQIGALIIIAIATIIAGGQEIYLMAEAREVTLADLLLLFIYLEVFTMVAVYMTSGALPVRMPLYIAIVALARHLILDTKHMTEWQLLAVSAGMLLIACAILVIRYGHVRFPYEKSLDRTISNDRDD
ncbi:MAG: phosphate-starvation-inducible PsiE family protein [Gammaproteobacteria bacterium]|jgi:protein PsiE